MHLISYYIFCRLINRIGNHCNCLSAGNFSATRFIIYGLVFLHDTYQHYANILSGVWIYEQKRQRPALRLLLITESDYHFLCIRACHSVFSGYKIRISYYEYDFVLLG